MQDAKTFAIQIFMECVPNDTRFQLGKAERMIKERDADGIAQGRREAAEAVRAKRLAGPDGLQMFKSNFNSGIDVAIDAILGTASAEELAHTMSKQVAGDGKPWPCMNASNCENFEKPEVEPTAINIVELELASIAFNANMHTPEGCEKMLAEFKEFLESAFATIRADEARIQAERYAACVEVLKRNQRDIKRLNEFCLSNALPTFDVMQVETDKALAELAGKGKI
jgi:hypothetical protein